MTPDQVMERDAALRRLEELQKGLRERGFGPDVGETGAIQRLTNLCRFLQTITRQNGTEEDGRLGRLQKALFAMQEAEKARQSFIQLLCDLQSSLKNLLKEPGETTDGYAARLQQIHLSKLERLANESDEDHEARCKERHQSLKPLGLDPAGYDHDILSSHREAWKILTDLKGKPGTEGKDCHLEKRWLETLSTCEEDWEWAHAQVLVRLARECLAEGLSQPKCCERAVQAMRCLEEAIKTLERRGSLQVREQGLYGLLAKAHLLQARGASEEIRKNLLCALSYGRLAVEMTPERAQDRLILVQVYSHLGDYPQAKTEAEIVLDLDSGCESLRNVGASFWDRVATSRGRGARQEALDEAVRFFTYALRLLESEAFNETSPDEQAQTHAGLHFWLGKFLCERTDLSKGIVHLEIARALGFKPLESCVVLGWAYLEAGAHEKSEKCFLDALSRAKPPGRDGSHILEAPGEEKPIGDLQAEANLGLSYLFAQLGLSLERAEEHATEAEGSLKLLGSARQRELQAALCECRSRIALRRRDFRTAEEQASQALLLEPRSGAYCCLAQAHLARAAHNGHNLSEILAEARLAFSRARETDLRGRHQTEILRIQRQIKELRAGASRLTGVVIFP